MKVRKTRLDEYGKFISQEDMDSKTPTPIQELLSVQSVAMITVTFADGNETLWVKVPDMKRKVVELDYTGK